MEVAGGRASERLFLLEPPEEREGEMEMISGAVLAEAGRPSGRLPGGDADDGRDYTRPDLASEASFCLLYTSDAADE